MADYKVRIGEETYMKLKQLADKSGKSMRELVEEAINAYLLGHEGGLEGKEIKGITGKIIPLQYPARCKRCGKSINPGELAYWVKITYTDNSVRSYVICLDCYYQSGALKEYYLKKKQLEAVIRGLKKEADELAQRVMELRRYKELIEAREEVRRLLREVSQYASMAMGERREVLAQIQEALERLLEAIDRLNAKIESIEVGEGGRPRSQSQKVWRRGWRGY